MPEILETKIRKKIVEANATYNLIEDQDRVMVAVSGGKDSTALLLQLEEIRKKAPFKFSVTAVMLDQKQPGFNVNDFAQFIESRGLEFHVIEEDTYSIVQEKSESGKAFCGLCSRLRRGILYNYAHKHGYTKIALGHHRDDLNETILMNLFYAGQIAAMPPKLLSDDGRNTVIRPLCYVPESWIIGYATQQNFPIIPCNLCGSQDGLKRQQIKALLQGLADENHNIPNNILAAQSNIRPSQLMDKNHWQF